MKGALSRPSSQVEFEEMRIPYPSLVPTRVSCQPLRELILSVLLGQHPAWLRTSFP